MTTPQNTNTVYRIQDKDGRGPYKPGFSSQWGDMRCLIDGSKFPTFMDEFPGIIDRLYQKFEQVGGHFGCGFRTMKQLENWFTRSEREKLKKFGYNIVAIEPHEILAESDIQLVFWHKKPLNKAAKVII